MKPKLLFLYELADNLYAQDGLHSAIEILREEFDITKANIKEGIPELSGYDYVLGHGGWSGSVDNLIKANLNVIPKCGLCIGGNINPPESPFLYSSLFCETRWYLSQIKEHPNARVAFGINTNIFYPTDKTNVFDYLGVGSLAKWKRWELMGKKRGLKLVVGEFQKDNPIESMVIVGALMAFKVGVLPNVDPYTLSKLYNASKKVYIPSTDYGGGERSVWEAKSCGVDVECEPDNLKLKELIDSPVKSHIDYAKELSIGINKCLK
jgi:hypothetical protein